MATYDKENETTAAVYFKTPHHGKEATSLMEFAAGSNTNETKVFDSVDDSKPAAKKAKTVSGLLFVCKPIPPIEVDVGKTWSVRFFFLVQSEVRRIEPTTWMDERSTRGTDRFDVFPFSFVML